MNLAERRAAVREALIADPRTSNRMIQAAIGGAWSTIAEVRGELVAARLIEDGPTVGRDGVPRMVRRGAPERAAEPGEEYIPTAEEIRAEAEKIRAEAPRPAPPPWSGERVYRDPRRPA